MDQDDFEEIAPRMQQFHFEEDKKVPVPQVFQVEGHDEIIGIIHHSFHDWIRSNPKRKDIQAVRSFLTYFLKSTERQLGSDFKPNDYDKRSLDEVFTSS